MADALRRRLSGVEVDFLSALAHGEDALLSFQQRWSTLLSDIEQSPCLDDETSELAHSTANRVAVLAESLLDLKIETEDIQSSLATEVAELVQGLDISETASRDSPCHCELSQQSFHPVAPYIEAAYRWFMRNLHKPYPSQAVKIDMARTSKTSLYAIDRWFMRTRQRVGWSAIRKQFFCNNRKATIDAACCAFSGDPSSGTLPAHIRLKFLEMRENAAELYDHKLQQSELSSGKFAIVHDASAMGPLGVDSKKPALSVQQKRANAEAREAWRVHRKRERQRANRKAAESYPSPENSVRGSPAHSNLSFPPSEDDSDSENDTSMRPPLPVSHKRRRLSLLDSTRSSPSDTDDRLFDHTKCTEPKQLPVQMTYTPLTPQSAAGDLSEDRLEQVTEWMSSVSDIVFQPQRSRTPATPIASPHCLRALTPCSPSYPESFAPLPQVKRPSSILQHSSIASHRKRRSLECNLDASPQAKRLRRLPLQSCGLNGSDVPLTPSVNTEDEGAYSTHTCFREQPCSELPCSPTLLEGVRNLPFEPYTPEADIPPSIPSTHLENEQPHQLGIFDLGTASQNEPTIGRHPDNLRDLMIAGLSHFDLTYLNKKPCDPALLPHCTSECDRIFKSDSDVYVPDEFSLPTPDTPRAFSPQCDTTYSPILTHTNLPHLHGAWSPLAPNQLCSVNCSMPEACEEILPPLLYCSSSPSDTLKLPEALDESAANWLNWLTDQIIKLRPEPAPHLPPFDHLTLFSRAFISASCLILSGHERCARLAYLRAQEREIARLKGEVADI